MAGGILQTSGQWVIDQLAKLQAETEKRRTEIAMNNGRIMALDKRAQSISDPARRERIRAQLHQMALRQGSIAKVYRTFGARVVEIAAKAKAWLKQNGYSTGMGGLGVIQVPTSIVVVLGIGAGVWIVNAWLANSNKSMDKGIGEFQTITGMIESGKLTPEQGIAYMQAANASTAANMPKGDPLGLADLAAAVTPLAAIALGIMLLPPLMEAFNARPRRALKGAA